MTNSAGGALEDADFALLEHGVQRLHEVLLDRIRLKGKREATNAIPVLHFDHSGVSAQN